MRHVGNLTLIKILKRMSYKKFIETVQAPGSTIFWQYMHQIGRSRFKRVKEGIFLRTTKAGTAVVRFNGNKFDSRVPLDKLYVEE